MNKALAIGLAIAALGVSAAEAGSIWHRRARSIEVLPPSDVLTTVRELDLAPDSEVVRRGPYYVLHAVDLRGVEQRIVADAQFGDILSIMPGVPYDYVPYYVRAPRIIHVPDAVKRHSGAAPSDVPEQAAIAPAKILSRDE
jgi:hypothetical protein